MKTLNGWMTTLGFAAVLVAGVALSGCGGGGGEAGSGTAENATTATANPAEVVIEVTDAGFVPAVANVPKGQAVTLVVTRKTAATCATEMVFAGTGEKHDLPLNQTVRIELPADRAETLDYACAMDMIKGKVVSK
ncbi:MAG: cupredoxin domain-containing protein [Candidatus Eisenbacteria bacterium]